MVSQQDIIEVGLMNFNIMFSNYVTHVLIRTALYWYNVNMIFCMIIIPYICIGMLICD